MKHRNISNDFAIRTEENNTSVDLDFTIKEALETLKTKDESFRSTNSAFSREVSPIPSIRSRRNSGSNELRTVASTNSIHRRPYFNKSVPDSPNTSMLASTRFLTSQNFKDSELDEFLLTERLVETEASNGKVTWKGNEAKKGISIKKIEYSKSKPELGEKKNRISREGKRNILVKLDSKQATSARGVHSEKVLQAENALQGFRKKHLDIVQSVKIRKIPEGLIEKHRNFICKKRDKLFSSHFVKHLIFSSWKGEWEKARGVGR